MTAAQADDRPMEGEAGDGWAEWRQNWPLVVTATVGMSITAVHLYSMGVLLDPIRADTGWSRTEITFGQTISSAISIVLAPVCGMMMDRWGARRIVLPGSIVFCLGLMAVGLTGHSLLMWYAMWSILSLGLIGLKPNVWVGAVSQPFVVTRGLAFAIVISGVGLCSATVPSIANYLLGHYGWRGAYVGLGVIWLILVLPLSFLFLRTTPDRRTADRSPRGIGVSVAAGLRSRAFARLAVAGFLFSVALVAVLLHFVPMMVDHGIGRTTAAGVAGLIGVFSIVGRLITGMLLDRFSGRRVGGISFMLPIVPMLLVLFFELGTGGWIAAAILFGLSVGAELDVLAYLSTRHFGLRNYATLFGFIISVLAAATSLGPIIASMLRDATGSYQVFIWATLPAFAISALAIWTLPDYPLFAVDDVPSEPPSV
ncbi:MFS transporter [Sphingomonas bacterium]|uniref:MFS transporter n=1 Tax=Sphingomonas bacterium TaxID=1895847 RepID=UPI0015753F65|nr:MFS transporter [Sphingomonas bacterium]